MYNLGLWYFLLMKLISIGKALSWKMNSWSINFCCILIIEMVDMRHHWFIQYFLYIGYVNQRYFLTN